MTRAAAAAAITAVLAFAGCGGEEGKRPPAGGGGKETRTQTAATEDEARATATTEATPERPEAQPEEQPGGAGDEVPARSPATFTGRSGRIGPALVRVPPFIAVQVSLRSADGAPYRLRVAGRTVRSGQSTTLAGLRPGAAYVGRGSDGRRLRIEASAEPGP